MHMAAIYKIRLILLLFRQAETTTYKKACNTIQLIIGAAEGEGWNYGCPGTTAVHASLAPGHRLRQWTSTFTEREIAEHARQQNTGAMNTSHCQPASHVTSTPCILYG